MHAQCQGACVSRTDGHTRCHGVAAPWNLYVHYVYIYTNGWCCNLCITIIRIYIYICSPCAINIQGCTSLVCQHCWLLNHAPMSTAYHVYVDQGVGCGPANVFVCVRIIMYTVRTWMPIHILLIVKWVQPATTWPLHSLLLALEWHSMAHATGHHVMHAVCTKVHELA